MHAVSRRTKRGSKLLLQRQAGRQAIRVSEKCVEAAGKVDQRAGFGAAGLAREQQVALHQHRAQHYSPKHFHFGLEDMDEQVLCRWGLLAGSECASLARKLQACACMHCASGLGLLAHTYDAQKTGTCRW